MNTRDHGCAYPIHILLIFVFAINLHTRTHPQLVSHSLHLSRARPPRGGIIRPNNRSRNHLSHGRRVAIATAGCVQLIAANWLQLARSRRGLVTGPSQMIPRRRLVVVNERHRHCLRPSSARPTGCFLCQRSRLSILSAGARGRNISITSLRHSDRGRGCTG